MNEQSPMPMSWPLKIHRGDCQKILRFYPDGIAQCCVTSPPYWGLRDYGTASWEGGDSTGLCQHRIFDESVYLKSESTSTLQSRSLTNSHGQHGWKSVCGHCGARRIDSQLGLESTPEEYITKMIAVFREIWRVLRDDGTLWVNMGDSYATSVSNNGVYSDKSTLAGFTSANTKGRQSCDSGERRKLITGLKPKDLCMMPARLAMALQADGWYLRSDIIWHKPNPMPESVTDRPTKSHEYIFLLAKQEKYFYDAEAIRGLWTAQ
jgi:site-specific DNA-methyltransferase (cytosine-N4-specific)